MLIRKSNGNILIIKLKFFIFIKVERYARMRENMSFLITKVSILTNEFYHIVLIDDFLYMNNVTKNVCVSFCLVRNAAPYV